MSEHDRQAARRPRVAVIGGGVSGLTVAFELMERAQRLPGGIELTCLERGERSGGNIMTVHRDGFVCEWGPNGFLDNSPPTLTLVRRLGIRDRVTRADRSSANRFIFRAGKLREVPTRPPAFLRSDILPWGAKLRVLMEPLMPSKRSDSDESVFDFASRRIGRGAASVLVDAMVTGIYAGDVRRLSLPATFPRMQQMEAEHGTLFRAMLAKRRQARESGEQSGGGPAGPGGTLTSFRAGMQELTDTLAARLGERLSLRTRVESIGDLGRRGFRIHRAEGAPLDVEALVLACPAWHAAPLVGDMDAEMSREMGGIGSASLAVVHLGYREGAFGQPPNGFGFLVPRGQGLRILGTIWASCVFPGRAPKDSVLFTNMIGGAHDREAAGLDDAALLKAVKDDLLRAMGIVADPWFVEIMRHPRGIPQYNLGHPERVRRIERRLDEHPGLFVSGNSYHGISVNACVEEAPRVAEAVLDHLARRAGDA